MDDNVALETRDILDADGNVIGTLTLSECTPEEVWQNSLAVYSRTDAPLSEGEIVLQRVIEAKEFGAQLINDFIKENVLLDINHLGLANHVRKFLREVRDALEAGSLYDAITEIRLLDSLGFDFAIITSERMLALRNKIEAKLGVPLADAWYSRETWIQKP